MSFVLCCFKQKRAYEMRISDLSSYVCSSDLANPPSLAVEENGPGIDEHRRQRGRRDQIGQRLGQPVEPDPDRRPEHEAGAVRSEERRDGKEDGSKVRHRGSTNNSKKKT